MMENEVVVANNFYSKYCKRILDIVLSGSAIIILLPLLMLVYVLELHYHGKPAVYCTKRPGKDGKIFNLYKFRSMTNERGDDGLLLPESKRLTKFGMFLRKASIDELAGLFNILKGDMSIIGPRPLLVEYLPLYNDYHSKRHLIRPGLACVRIIPTDSKTWTWREQFDNDIYYIENISFMTDIKMVFAVLKEVIKGADYRVSDTRVPFDGKNLDEIRSKDEINNVIRYDSISK